HAARNPMASFLLAKAGVGRKDGTVKSIAPNTGSCQGRFGLPGGRRELVCKGGAQTAVCSCQKRTAESTNGTLSDRQGHCECSNDLLARSDMLQSSVCLHRPSTNSFFEFLLERLGRRPAPLVRYREMWRIR